MRSRLRRLAALAVTGWMVAHCSGNDAGDLGPVPDAAEILDSGPVEPNPLLLRPLQTADDRVIVDDLGRQVLLRGANVTSLGEYWQGDPECSPTLPTTDADWDAMAARGLNVVRLVIHWSRIEPSRGVIDEAYLDAIDAAVTAASQRGIYTVLDMHQDAYTACLSTEPGTECPEGTHPAKGWDGAPCWAVFDDGLSTCTPGERNASPAVLAAWNAFYDNRDGIRDRFVASWAAVAKRFAGRPEVAGYDLLNEPEVSRPARELEPLYRALLKDAISAIRKVEADAPFEHLIFYEPGMNTAAASVTPMLPSPATIGVSPANLVFAPHNYVETIGHTEGSLGFEAMNDLLLLLSEGFEVPLWIGEYGFWDTSAQTLEKLNRYALDEDARFLGGAWWQWRQPCGDPHSIEWGVGCSGQATITHLNRLQCPGDVDLGPTEDFLRVLGRGYPRATPGRLTRLRSEWRSGALDVRATVDRAGGILVVWSPTLADTHELFFDNLSDVSETVVDGGRLITATVVAPGDYGLRILPRTPGVSCQGYGTPGATAGCLLPVRKPAYYVEQAEKYFDTLDLAAAPDSVPDYSDLVVRWEWPPWLLLTGYGRDVMIETAAFLRQFDPSTVPERDCRYFPVQPFARCLVSFEYEGGPCPIYEEFVFNDAGEMSFIEAWSDLDGLRPTAPDDPWGERTGIGRLSTRVPGLGNAEGRIDLDGEAMVAVASTDPDLADLVRRARDFWGTWMDEFTQASEDFFSVGCGW